MSGDQQSVRGGRKERRAGGGGAAPLRLGLLEGGSFPVSRTRRRGRAFTLIELLVVVAIIGILATIGLPALKGLGEANINAAATRQLLDDLALARLRAINERTTVYIVFVSPSVIDQVRPQLSSMNSAGLQLLTNLVPMQFSGYALIAKRTVGDQPGRDTPRYLSDWKRLPDGFLFAPFKFDPAFRNHPDPNLRSFSTASLPFPDGTSPLYVNFPAIGFNSLGQLVTGREESIPLARGTVMIERDSNNRVGLLAVNPNDVILTPQPRSTNDYQYVGVNWLTGRAKAHVVQVQ